MMNCLRYLLLLLVVACNTNQKPSQSLDKENDSNLLEVTRSRTLPEIGKPMPDFMLHDIKYFNKQKASLKDFRGKWLVLDFWNRYCTNCIKSFDKVDKLSKAFKEEVVIMLVGRNDGKYYQGSDKMYEQVRQRFQLDLPLVYQARLFDDFGVSSVPHIIWIDPKGVVRAITTSDDLNAKNLKAFLEGETPYFFHKANSEQEQTKKEAYDFRKPLLVDDNGGNDGDFLYRSILTGVNNKVYGSLYPSYFPPLNGDLAGFSAINITLQNLYNAAYGDTIRPNPDIIEWPNNYGKWWNRPLLEVKDSTFFKPDSKTGKGIYCYELIVPKSKASNTSYRQKIVQRDLKNYFGHEVTVETKEMPYWKMVATKQALKRLKTKGEQKSVSGNGTKMTLTNQPMAKLISIMWGLYQLDPPFIDETGIKGNIDITLDGVLTDFEDLKSTLRDNGLELVEGKRKMKVIIVRDPATK